MGKIQKTMYATDSVWAEVEQIFKDKVDFDLILSEWVEYRKSQTQSSEELKKEIKELKNKLVEKMSSLPGVIANEKRKAEFIKEEENIIKRRKFLQSLYTKCDFINNLDKIKLFQLAIKENRFPELKEELLEQIKEWGGKDE